ncbi:MAG: hypothetical protein K0R24_1098 [Gammaproteobacteria bacterium]|jgi:predicted nucleotidyltransferase component of viral defense system|nr:hypothetical protein [Gammaproteobacteria bacterium]
MSEIENFNHFIEQVMKSKNLAHMRPVIAKELLHYDILFSLEQSGLLDDLTFQGGTSLRLCYGAPRFSEDLDFVGGREFSTAHVLGIKKCIEKYIGERYGLEIIVKGPKKVASQSDYTDIKVNKWQVKITTSPERKDLPKQTIKLEIVNVPAYSRTPLALQQNYEFLPDGYEDMLIMTETLDEIMADKIISLVNCQKYIRHRDIWDLRWLKQHDAKINKNYILSKIKDYEIEDYQKKLKNMINQLDDIVRSKAFIDEMSRFLPMDVQERTFKKDKFIDFLISEDKMLLQAVNKIL